MRDIEDKGTIIETVKNATIAALDDLTNGERVRVKDIVDKVVGRTGVMISHATSLVPMFIKQWANDGNGTLKKGKFGGVTKGIQPERVDPRPRCGSCNQVLRAKKHDDID